MTTPLTAPGAGTAASSAASVAATSLDSSRAAMNAMAPGYSDLLASSMKTLTGWAAGNQTQGDIAQIRQIAAERNMAQGRSGGIGQTYGFKLQSDQVEERQKYAAGVATQLFSSEMQKSISDANNTMNILEQQLNRDTQWQEQQAQLGFLGTQAQLNRDFTVQQDNSSKQWQREIFARNQDVANGYMNKALSQVKGSPYAFGKATQGTTRGDNFNAPMSNSDKAAADISKNLYGTMATKNADGSPIQSPLWATGSGTTPLPTAVTGGLTNAQGGALNWDDSIWGNMSNVNVPGPAAISSDNWWNQALDVMGGTPTAVTGANT